MTAGLPQHSSIGPYRVIDFVGAGGMGAVYRVSHRATGKIAAAKVLGGGSLTPRALERFRNEARILQALSHPGIAAMYDFVDVQGSPCLVMEYVDGDTLEQLLRTRGPFAPDDAVKIFSALADAVSYIHQRGVVHRDLKTNNVKLDSLGRVKLLDFGIATADGTPRLTSTGNVVGTLMSLAPEQLRTGRAEPRSDIWALGILFYELLTGRPPFEGGPPAFVGERILQGTFSPPSSLRPDLPPKLDRIVARCLRVRPEDRYASAEALLTDLHQFSLGTDAAPTPAVLDVLHTSGEVATKLAREWRVALAAVLAMGAFAFFLWSLRTTPLPADGGAVGVVVPAPPTTAREPRRRDTLVAELGPHAPRGDSATLRSVGQESAAASSTATSVSRGALIIRVLEGTADVYVNDVFVGPTPYTLKAPIGAEVQLRLRRPGCDDLQRVLRLDEMMRETIESLPHCRTPPP